MKCLVLAAGYATRLYPLTENFPKPLLAVGDRPILNWLLDDLDGVDLIDEFIVISNHKFADHFNKWKNEQHYRKKLTVVDDGTSDNDHRLGAVRDIWFAMESLKLNDDLLVLAGDNLLDFSLADFVDYAVKKGTSCVMCHEENDLKRQQRTAIIAVDEKGLILSYEEKPQKPKGNLAVPPFYVFKKEDAAFIPQAIAQGCNADAPGSYAAWLSKKSEVYAWIMPGYRYDIGDKESYERIKAVYKRK